MYEYYTYVSSTILSNGSCTELLKVLNRCSVVSGIELNWILSPFVQVSMHAATMRMFSV